ncbi:MAG TPA: protein kinase [Verrucomicrobiae bacterium]|nr:protein kinase [Verrucomicrobiae bacterium]
MDEAIKRVVTAQNESPTLPAGSHFGRYEILGALGTGGMGEVYRARDPRLGRELAIKILPRKLSDSKLDVKRFEREAGSASVLNHPNIVTIFELGQVENTYYIAMELVEGELLRDMLRDGPIPLQTVMRIAAQIVDGLAKAHAAGVMHRDLKPENVMVSRDGLVKILDFGLAKLVSTDTDTNLPLDLETVSTSETNPGAVLGTLPYMSPEQANGQPLDFRSDQFSLGSLLYEMVTGKRAFPHQGAAEILAAILRDQPEAAGLLNPQAPAPLCWVIERCLAKSPKDRYDSTHDLARDLAAIRDRLPEAPSRHLAPRINTLPSQATAFIGRERELAAVKELLLREDVRVVTLTGPGGIGKTRLALQVATELRERFDGGICFIQLAAVSDASLIPSIVAQGCGIRETGRPVSIQSLKEYLQDSRSNLLLIFDNFEHLLTAAPLVAELITAAQKLRVLVTSRAPLHIYGEFEFPVPTLALPELQHGTSPSILSQNPTIALFMARAVAIKPNFALTDENARAVATICTRLDGLPLAIELAAARIKLLSPSAMQSRLESSLQLLTGGAKDLPMRQQTLRATMDWSYDLLSPAEQTLFRRLSVFVGGCTLEGVEAVCNTKQDLQIDVLDGMGSLVNNSLVRQVEQSAGEPRFALLDTVREYGLERLAACGEESGIRKAHAAYCLVLAEECAAQAADPASTEWLSLLEVEHNNCRAALDWLTRSGNAEWGLRLGSALFQFWETREHLTEGRDRLEKLLKLQGAATRSNSRARVLFAAGVLASEQGDHRAAWTLLEESLQIARELNDTRGVGIALNALAVSARDDGEVSKARSLFEESLTVWRDLNDRAMVARALSNVASVVKSQRNYALARSLHEESREIFEELGDSTCIAWSLNYQGDVAQEQGEILVARELYEQCLKIFRKLGDKWGVAGCLVDLGNLARDEGDEKQSRLHYAESMKLFQELGQKRGVARVLDCLACSAALQSQAERALRLAGSAAAMRRVLGVPLPAEEQTRLEKALDLARQSLSPAKAAAAWMDGWTMATDKAIQEALSFT